MPDWRLTRLRGEFCVTWQDGDIRRRYRLGTDDQAEAARRAAVEFAKLTRPKGKTVADLWEGYCLDREGRAVLVTMGFTWRALQERFGFTLAEDISIAACRAHTAERRKAGIGDGTIHTELGHLRMVLKWAEAHRLIAKAPDIERPMKPEPKDHFLTREQVQRMVAAAKAPHVALAIRLMVGTGARNAAALELTWDRVDFAKRLIHLRNPFDQARRKGRATVPINDSLYEALETAKKGALTPFVIEYGGLPVKSIKRGVKAAAAKAHVDHASPHVFRHSAAVWMAEAGISMKEIADFLGHGDSRISERVYAKFSPDRLRSAASALEV